MNFFLLICSLGLCLACLPSSFVVNAQATTAAAICTQQGAVGLFPNPSDTTCKQYARCFLQGGLQGAFYTCQGTSLFNPTLRACVTTGFVCPVPAPAPPPGPQAMAMGK